MKKNHKINLFCIHGNLQKPSVWNILDDFEEEFPELKNTECKGLSIHKIDLWSDVKESIRAWSRNFCSEVRKNYTGQKNILIGYSLGGRLAMDALCTDTELWDGSVIISAHPGFITEKSKGESFEFDKKWAERFLTDHWNCLMDDWNRQKVFCGFKPAITLDEHDVSRNKIASIFTSYSKGRQKYLVKDIKSLRRISILYITGEKDKKYCKIAREMTKQCTNIDFKIIKNAAHRVPWENTAEFKNSLADFLNKGYCKVTKFHSIKGSK